MNKSNVTLIVFGAVLVVAILIFAVAMSMVGDKDDRIETSGDHSTSDDTSEGIGYDYSQYDVLKDIVSKFNSRGGTIISAEDHQYDFTSSYTAQLKDDLLIIISPSNNQLTIFHIHDIRSISVNP